MNAISRVLVVVAAFAVSALGHAVIVTPTPFNVNPSKSFTCGGASSGPVTVVPNGVGQLNWKLIAGDGAGDIRMLVDPTGVSGNFPTQYANPPTGSIAAITLTGGTTPTVVGTTYTFNFDASATACTGTVGSITNVCTAQVSSNSNWVSCFSYTKTAPPAASTGSSGSNTVVYQGQCVTVTSSSLPSMCNMLLGKVVWIPDGQSLTVIDGTVSATMSQNLPNSRVFINDQADYTVVTPCQQSYRDFLCAQAFVPCNTAKTQPTSVIYGQQPCKSTCQQFTCWCDLNPIHADLYDCTTYNNAAFDSTGSCTLVPYRAYGPNNSTCIPTSTSTAGTCVGDVCAAPHRASQSPLVLGALAVVAAVALWVQNH